MSADMPPDVRDRAAQAAQSTWLTRPSDGWRAVVDAVAAVLLGEDVIVLSKADAAWLCGVIHGEAQTEQDYSGAHQLLEGGA